MKHEITVACVCVCVCVLILFLSLWLCWVFAEFQAFSSFGSRGYPLVAVTGVSLRWLLSWSKGSRAHSLQELQFKGSNRAQAQELCFAGSAALRHVGSSQTRDGTHVSCTLAGGFFTTEPLGKPSFFFLTNLFAACGIKHRFPALGAQSFSHWTIRELPKEFFLLKNSCSSRALLKVRLLQLSALLSK